MNVWLKLSEKDLQLSAVVVVTLFFRGKRSRRDLKFFTQAGSKLAACARSRRHIFWRFFRLVNEPVKPSKIEDLRRDDFNGSCFVLQLLFIAEIM